MLVDPQQVTTQNTHLDLGSTSTLHQLMPSCFHAIKPCVSALRYPGTYDATCSNHARQRIAESGTWRTLYNVPRQSLLYRRTLYNVPRQSLLDRVLSSKSLPHLKVSF